LKIFISTDLTKSCSFFLTGKHYIVGGDTFEGNGRRNLQVDLTSNKLIKLQNLPIDFSSGSCVGNSDITATPQAILCSSLWYAGVPELNGRDCMRFDGTDYGMIWFTEKNHHGGALTNFNYIRGCGNVPFNIGGGDYEDGLFHFECWGGTEWNGPWSLTQSSDDPWLVGLKGFTALSVPYKQRYDTDALMIFGGTHDEFGPNPNAVWWLDGSYMTLTRFPEPLNLVRSYHKTIAIDDLANTGNYYIYHIGGPKYYGETLIEVWRLRWDRDPAFREPQDIGCPEWCHWGIENLGGICSSPLWNNGQCTYGMNHPSFEKTSFAVGEEYEHMLNTNNPHVFSLN